MESSNDIVNVPDLSWMNEKIERLEKNNWLYKLSCLLLFRPKEKITYQEMYMLLSRLNEKNLGQEESSRRALIEVLKIYLYNNKNTNKEQ